MSWEIRTAMYGETDETTVEAPTVGEAIATGLEQLGLADNDEGAITIEVSGAA